MNYKNTKYLLNQRPIGMPDNDCWVLDYEDITSISSGEIIIKNEYLSIDPYMRGRMSAAKSYAAPLEIGEVITGGAVGKIIESKCPNFSVGNIV